MRKKSLSIYEAYSLIEPGPVVMVTTSFDGIPNIMTMAWHMMIEFKPPMIACMLSGENYSYELLKATQECALNIPTVELAPIVVKVGTISGEHIDKFAKFHLTQEPADVIDVPLIKECYANVECKVIDMQLVNKYNIFILEVVAARVATAKKRHRTLHHLGNGLFVVDGKMIKLPMKMKK